MTQTSEQDVLHITTENFDTLPADRVQTAFGMIAKYLVCDDRRDDRDFTVTEVIAENKVISYDVEIHHNNPKVRAYITHLIAEIYTQNHELADLDK